MRIIEICHARPEHVEGIARVCADSYRATYRDLYTEEYIESVIREFYHHDRLLREVTQFSREWGGYFVAVENGEVIGAGGGGMISASAGELFVLYVDPGRRNEGIGTRLLQAVTDQQLALGATEQWVSVQKGNMKGIPFYEARGFELQYERPGWHNERYVTLRYKRLLK